MQAVLRAEEIAGRKVGFLLDTKGPEIRTELFSDAAKADPDYDDEENLFNYKTGEKKFVLQQNKASNQKKIYSH